MCDQPFFSIHGKSHLREKDDHEDINQPDDNDRMTAKIELDTIVEMDEELVCSDEEIDFTLNSEEPSNGVETSQDLIGSDEQEDYYVEVIGHESDIAEDMSSINEQATNNLSLVLDLVGQIREMT